jgi:predicted Zn-dependent peptidase
LKRTAAAIALLVGAAAILPAAESDFHIPFEKYTLKNGMRVVLSRDNAVPVVAVYLIYDVGARSEEQGRTGFAHLFEHMMFEGSANVKKGEHFKYVQSNGGTMNGSTHPDYTDFYETMPSNKLGLALWLESDRMRSLAITEESLKVAKEAVLQERRRDFSQPYRAAIAQWPAFAFGNFHNAHPVIGPSPDDLDTATAEDVLKFFHTYYAPNNAVVVISGEFDPAEAKKLVGGYFGDIAAQPPPKRPDLNEAPRANGKTMTIREPIARAPALIAGWPAPPRHSQEWYAIQMIDAVLTSGDNARLKLQMMKGRQSLLQADANLGWPGAAAIDFKEPADYATIFVYKPNFSVNEILDQYQTEVDRIAREGVGGTELGRAKAVLRFQMALGVQTALSRARQLGIGELMDGDAGGAEKDSASLLSVTSEQMQAAAKKYLTAGRRVVMVIEPAGARQ